MNLYSYLTKHLSPASQAGWMLSFGLPPTAKTFARKARSSPVVLQRLKDFSDSLLKCNLNLHEPPLADEKQNQDHAHKGD